MAEHKHAWRNVMHLDGCHFYTNTYSCACGATASTHTERAVTYNPYSAVWMEREDGEEPCARCEELMGGAEPQHKVDVREPSVSPLASRARRAPHPPTETFERTKNVRPDGTSNH